MKLNITQTYTYDSNPPVHAAQTVDPLTEVTNPFQDISYTPFNKISRISEGDANLNTDFTQLNYTYGLDNERRKMIEQKTVAGNLTSTRTKYYSTNFEKESITIGSTTTNREINYIFAPDGLAAINENIGSVNKMYYVATDNLGSINMIVNADGTVASDLSYDAWGRRRNPQDWSYTNITFSTITDRGYTMHEHMDAFKLINMNGRAYDPVLSQFLSPDPFVQSPTYTQSYNRYTYCLNNPLKYTDPSGYISWVQQQAQNYAWGATYYEFDGAFYDFDVRSQLKAGENTENLLFLHNSYFANEDNYGGWATSNKSNRTNIWTSEDKDGNHMSNRQPLETIEGDNELLTGAFLENEAWSLPLSTRELNSMLSPKNNGQDNTNNKVDYGLNIAFGMEGMKEIAKTIYNSEKWLSIKKMHLYNTKTTYGNFYIGWRTGAKKIGTGFKIGGYTLGLLNAILIHQEYIDGEIDYNTYNIEQTVNVFSIGGGPYGAAFGIGWEAGKEYGISTWWGDPNVGWWKKLGY